MLSNKYKFLKVFTLVLIFTIALASCKKDFFEIQDPNGIDEEVMWTDPGAIGLFLNRTYSLVMPQWPVLGGIHNTSDEMNNINTTFMYGQLLENSVPDIGTGNGIGTNRYFDIRRCNLAIDNINASSSLTETDKRSLKGQFFFLRAYTYFRLVRLYGGVPLILKAQAIADDNLQTPRAKTSECIAAIAKDLDSAAILLPRSWPTSDIGRITSAAARAVKGKVLLLWASPQFNINNESARWQTAYAANKEAYDTCIAHGYGLLSSYANIFSTEDHREVLLVRKYLASKDLGHNIENVSRPFSQSSAGSGSYQPTWNLVRSYLKSNGMPITSTDNSVRYDDTLFWQNRDPRFDATIAYNGGIWAFSGNGTSTTRKQWTYNNILDEGGSSVVTGFYCKRFVNPTLPAAAAIYNSNTGGGNGMDWIEMRFAEVVLNLAECANEIGNLTESKNMVRLIRQRAGIVQGNFDFGLDVGTNIPTMRNLILNERQIEFALEGARAFDLRRTRNLHLITNRLSYRVSVKSPFFAGTRPTNPPVGNIYLDVPDAFGFRPRDTVNINNKATYLRVFNITTTLASSLEGANVVSMPSNYYVYPMPNFFSQSPAIQQTIGWSGGSFNPYE